MGADETQIEASFCEAINTAEKQKSFSLAKRGSESRTISQAKSERACFLVRGLRAVHGRLV